jgi:polyisoprenoid-binding protein YceI
MIVFVHNDERSVKTLGLLLRWMTEVVPEAIVMLSPAWDGFHISSKGVQRTMLALCVSLAWTAPADAQQRAIDTEKSTLTVHVSKAGVFSALGHNHEIAAPIARGTVDATAHRVELHTSTGALQVRDPDVSDKDRAQIRTAMLGPEVLDAQRYPEIVFRSTAAEPSGTGSWRVAGTLALHGQTRAVVAEVKETAEGHYVGTSRFKQTDFDIVPFKAAGGAVRVKDEIRIDFEIQLMR